MYRLLSGELAFQGADLVDLGWNIRNAPTPTLPTSVGPELQIILERCLSKSPSGRYATSAELLAALNSISVNAKPRSRARLWATLSAGAVGAVAALGALALEPKPVGIAVTAHTVKVLPVPAQTAAVAEPAPVPVAPTPAERRPGAKPVAVFKAAHRVLDAGVTDGVFDERL
jgi:hypothetical protein